ncbi:hypothetical protein PGQ11_002783 [Apiospora arundinis]|uniref:Transposase n=1 Tax=Apiospora arundinis TaxID=335852 RepID=A0ABR2J324_9PEZI
MPGSNINTNSAMNWIVKFLQIAAKLWEPSNDFETLNEWLCDVIARLPESWSERNEAKDIVQRCDSFSSFKGLTRCS